MPLIGPRRWNRESFLRAACDLMGEELDWDSLDSGRLHVATSPAATLDGERVVIGAFDRADAFLEVLRDAEEVEPGVPVWVYVPEGLDLSVPQGVVVRRVGRRAV